MLNSKKSKYVHSAERRITNYLEVIKKVKSQKNTYVDQPPFVGSLQKRSYFRSAKVSDQRLNVLNRIGKMISIYKSAKSPQPFKATYKEAKLISQSTNEIAFNFDRKKNTLIPIKFKSQSKKSCNSDITLEPWP